MLTYILYGNAIHLNNDHNTIVYLNFNKLSLITIEFVYGVAKIIKYIMDRSGKNRVCPLSPGPSRRDGRRRQTPCNVQLATLSKLARVGKFSFQVGKFLEILAAMSKC